jgi:hypothetical protein
MMTVAAVVASVTVSLAFLTACDGGTGSEPPKAARGYSSSPTLRVQQPIERPNLTRIVGRRGPAVLDHVRGPTGDKSQSKLWFHDRRWWALMYNGDVGATQIYRRDPGRQVWVSTGVVVDTRDDARGDALSDGDKLYVATSTFYNSSWGNPPAREDVRAGSALLLRFSYLPQEKSYRLDGGFPAPVRPGASESITLGKDSTGQLWVAYTRFGKVFVNRTIGADEVWGKPFVLPTAAARVTSDDTASLVAFGGHQVGVMWSNQKNRTFYLAVHDDTAADKEWRTEVAYGQGVGGCSRGCANDHISLKALPDGRIFAAVKTANRHPDQPFIVVLVRDGAGWASHIAGTVGELHTRPLVVLDNEKKLLHLFTVVPEVGGAIYRKTTNVDRIAFERGLGVPFMSGGFRINNPTSTKQTVGSKSGVVVVATEKKGHYWYNTLHSR